ncbi:MAG: aldo/keto reductase [Spirochaetia bacterium]|jgi:aryl-alcohol dehydrogenase-like predicted oxidoreductase
MKQIALGTTGEKVSALCLGCMYFGTKVDEAMSSRILDAYTEMNGSFLDTANCYAFWIPGATGDESETLVGRWMRERDNRNRIFLATKVGARPSGGSAEGPPEGLSARVIESAVHESLRRLGTDTIDLLYTHVPDRSTTLEETIEALDRLVRAGKVRFIGCSNEAAWRVERARGLSLSHGWASFCCVQNRYTYLRPTQGAVLPQVCISEELLDYAATTASVTLLAYSPLLGGAYAREEHALPQEYANSDSRVRWKTLSSAAQARGVSRGSLVLAWLMSGVPPLIPLVAASTVEQLRENLDAGKIVLDAACLRDLTEAAG